MTQLKYKTLFLDRGSIIIKILVYPSFPLSIKFCNISHSFAFKESEIPKTKNLFEKAESEMVINDLNFITVLKFLNNVSDL